MREIKYRFWHKDEKRFVGPNHYRGRRLMMDCEGDVWLVEEDSCQTPASYEEAILPIPFTGLRDKHGWDIYEGDIVRRKRFPASEDFIGAVEWSDEAAAFVISPNITLIEDLLSRATDVEVIGNIYENSNLLIANS
jgi:uncharacterized phage protein (TIGR01671 family)